MSALADAVVMFLVVGAVIGSFGTLAWHDRPCHDWPFVNQGDHVVGNGTWVRFDVNSIGLVENHSCLDEQGLSTKSWEETIERRLSPEPFQGRHCYYPGDMEQFPCFDLQGRCWAANETAIVRYEAAPWPCTSAEAAR